MKKISLPTQMAIGLILGLIVGAFIAGTDMDKSWLQFLGQIFLNLVRMVVVPLVFATLVAGAASVGNVSKLGRVAVKTLLFYFTTTAFATAVGLLVANLMNPGLGLSLATEGYVAKDFVAPSLAKVFLDIIPINPMGALSQGNMLQVIFFALLLGFIFSMQGEKAKPLITIFDVFADAMIRMTGFVMYYAPIGVFGLMAYTVSMHGINVLIPLAKLIAVVYIAAICQIILVYIPCVKWSKVRVSNFFSECLSPLIIAFSTCSSAAALSTNLQTVQKLGASKSVSSFSISLGNTINMDGTAIYMGAAAIFAAQLYGIPMPFEQQLMVILLATLASVGSMGVPGAGLIMITMVFSQIGIPLEAIAIIAGVDRVLDMARTTINILGDATCALVVSKSEEGK